MLPNEARTHLIRLLRENSSRHMLYDVFRDFVELAACAISNGCDPVQYQAREERYMQLIGRYSADEQQRFPHMLAALTIALEAGPDDILGTVFEELGLANADRGQFFTPFSVSAMCARVVIDQDDLRQRVEARGFVTAHEPACGSGAMVMALADAMQSAGINYQQHLHVTAVDVDPRAVHMAYLQLSLLGIPATVIRGNTLTMELTEYWHTPMHAVGMWPQKLRRGYALGSGMDLDSQQQPANDNAPPPAAAAAGHQFDLFL